MISPPRPHSISLSHLGGRDHQEDASLADDTLALYAVADGMGASMSGRPAADLAIATLLEHGSEPLVAAVMAAHAAVFARTSAADQYWKNRDREPRPDSYELTRWLGMGTTIVAMRLAEGKATIAHVGDSRAYRWRDEDLERLTVDHRLTEDARRAGFSDEQIAELPQKVITRALGISADVDIESTVVDVNPGDVFLLASDGLSDAVADSMISTILRDHRQDLHAAAEILIRHAVENGEVSLFDNITILLVSIERAPTDT